MKFEIKQQAISGTLESSDIQIMVDNNDGHGIEIELESSVMNQFGKRIKEVIEETLTSLDVNNVKVKAVDKGALDCTVRARTIAAVYRSAGIDSEYDWEELDSWNV